MERMKTNKIRTYLCVARVAIDWKFRSNHPSDTRMGDGIHAGWMDVHGRSVRFYDQTGWLWSQETGCRVVILQRSKKQIPASEKSLNLYTPERWQREAEEIGFHLSNKCRRSIDRKA